MTAASSARAAQAHDVIIVGSGFGGLGMAIRLQQEGVDDFVVLERGDSIGGTWRDNTYPGAACDVVSHVYSFSFEPKSDWSSTYAKQQEIRDYIEACASKHRLHRKVRTNHDVTEARFDETTGIWTIQTDNGRTFTTPVLVMAVGGLKDPAWAKLPGIEDFAGPQMHSSRWDHDLSLAGKRIGVIGTGASAIQFVPEVAPVAEHTTVFQRTAPWIIPKGERNFLGIEKLAFRFVPGFRQGVRAREYLTMEATFKLFFQSETPMTAIGQRVLRQFIRASVKDRSKRAAVTPDITLGCKRVLKSSDWYPTIDRDDVALETTSIERITPTGARLADGRTVDFDVLIHGTGFTVEQPVGDAQIIGRDGVHLAERWGNRPTAYLGATVPGFPNMFMIQGPNTGLGHNSMIFMLEQGIEYALQAIALLRSASSPMTIEVNEVAHDAFVDEVDARHTGAVWASGCSSWYLNAEGKNFTLWPGSTIEFRRRLRRFEVASYEVSEVARVAQLPAA
ncbi:MAG: cation diffusion facilitator CzcD-associated flavoprotein CzcO [Glaciecola sp.]|jgi:cation diffusion facilitator CzcD-associated flavoprotein CzcO